MRLSKGLIIFLTWLGVYLIIPSLSSAADVEITDYSYLTHWTTGETVSFTLSARNNAAFVYNVKFAVVLTNHATGKEISPYPSTILAIASKTTRAMTATWVSKAGLYTVTLIIYNDDTGDELDREYGKEPIHVGSTTDSVAAFPRVLDLGALQYGRYMHPAPIEINWDYYSRTPQIRKDQPWYMRIYTDNHKRYKGVDGAIYLGRVPTQENGDASAMGSPAGLISEDGRYTIPVKVWCLNFGPDVEDGWDTNLLGPPPVKEDYYWKGPLLDTGKRDFQRVAWQWVPDYIDMSANDATWRKLIGQDSYNTHYVSDKNPTGDFTLPSPFQVFIAYETSPTSVVGKYSTDLIIEIYSP